MSVVRIIFKSVEGTDNLVFDRMEDHNGQDLKIGAWWIDEEPDGSLVSVLTINRDEIVEEESE